MKPKTVEKEDAVKPTIGRIVHYFHEDLRPCAGLVVDVESDSRVSMLVGYLTMVGINNQAHEQELIEKIRLDSHFHVPYSEDPKAGHWSWPPRV